MISNYNTVNLNGMDSITNICALENNIIISGKGKNNTLAICEITYGILAVKALVTPLLSTGLTIRHVNYVDNDNIIIVTNNTFTLYNYTISTGSLTNILVNTGSLRENVKSYVLKPLCDNHLLCKCSQHFHLIGTVKINNNIDFFIQTFCKHHPKNRIMYVIRGTINMTNLTLSPVFTLLGIYNLYRSAKMMCVPKEYLKTIVVTGVTFNAKHNVVQVLCSYHKSGFIAQINYYHLSNMYGTEFKIHSHNLTDKPRGISWMDDTAYIIISNNDNGSNCNRKGQKQRLYNYEVLSMV
jgi:hypothetical protein